MKEKRAYVTILSTDSYLNGVLVLFESLKKTQPTINTFVVIINEKINQKTIDILNKKQYKVILKKSISIPESIKITNSLGNTSNWVYTFDKFNLFELVEFDKIVYLDSDMYVNKNIDELFEKPNMSGVIAGKSYPGNESWKELNSGIMVIEPKKHIIDKLISTMIQMSKPKIKKFIVLLIKKKWTSNNKKHITQGNFKNLYKYIKGKGDQDIIEEYYHWKDNPQLELDEKYNIFAIYVDYYINKIGYEKEDLAIIHFIGSKKPWMLDYKEIEKYEEECKEKNNIYQLEFFNKYIEILKNISN